MTNAVQFNPRKTSVGQHGMPCGDFMDIPATITGQDGEQYINPDFDYVKKYHLNANPYPGAVLGPGLTRDFALTVPAEENHLGDLLVYELRATLVDATAAAVRDVFIEVLSFQNDRLFMNAPVENTLLFGDGFLNCCIPCCFMIQATNTVILRVTNLSANDISCYFTAVGKRFLPYHYPELRSRYLSVWNSLPHTPYWLTLDAQQLVVPAGTTQTGIMTVPGGGDFEIKGNPRIDIIPAGPGTNPDTQVFLSVAEGVGRTWENVFTLANVQATQTRAIAGMPNVGLYHAAQACHCPQVTQLFKRNSRIRVQVQNTGADDITVRYTMPGCMHYVSECPPGRSLDRIRSLEPTVGPFLQQESYRCPPYQQMQPVPGRGMQPVPPPPAPVPTPAGMMQVPLPAGGGVLSPTGPYAYLSKYYMRDPRTGAVVPIHGAAHGMRGMNGNNEWRRI